MEIYETIWINKFVEKIWRKHKVTPEEVEEVLMGSPKIRLIEKGNVKGENVYSAMGKTNSGRLLTIFFVKKRNSALIISARNMTQKERKFYEKKQKR